MKYKRQIKQRRREFRNKLRDEMIGNPALVMAVFKTYTAHKHRKHIMQIWELLGHNYKDAWQGYGNELLGKHICGVDEIFNTLNFAANDIYKEFKGEIPERIAMGDALGTAIPFVKNRVRGDVSLDKTRDKLLKRFRKANDELKNL